jgi:hypothetical protein
MEKNAKKGWFELMESRSILPILTLLTSVAAIIVSLYALNHDRELALLIDQKQEEATQERTYQQNLLKRANKIKEALRSLKYVNLEYFWTCTNKSSVNSFETTLNSLNEKRRVRLENLASASGGSSLGKLFNEKIRSEVKCLIQWNEQLYHLQKIGSNCPELSLITVESCEEGKKRYKEFCALNVRRYDSDHPLDEVIACINNDIDNFLISKKVRLVKLHKEIIALAEKANYKKIASQYSKKIKNIHSN